MKPLSATIPKRIESDAFFEKACKHGRVALDEGKIEEGLGWEAARRHVAVTL